MGSRLILLGTGVPTPNLQRGSACSALVRGDRITLIDCGHGAVHGLLRAGLDPLHLDEIFFTHHHFDHNIDFPYLVLSGWIMGRDFPVRVYGPKGTAKFVGSVFNTFEIDIACRLETGVQTTVGLDFRAQDIDEGFATEGPWRVRCRRVEHLKQLGNYTLGYRFESEDGSVAFSGDTKPCDAVVDLARGANILVHECFYSPEFEETGMVQGRNKAHPKLPAIHSSPEEVGAIATRAGVKRLVLTHLWTERDLDVLWKRIRRTFNGEILVGHDGMMISLE